MAEQVAADQFMNALFQKPSHTIGEFISTVLAITNEVAARQFAADYIEWLAKQNDRVRPAEEIMRANIGWCFGEGMQPDQIKMWQAACNASHPWFGTTLPTPEECLVLGKKFAGAVK